MTEEEWLSCTDAEDVERMLEYLALRGGQQPQSCAAGRLCCRYLHDLLQDDNSQKAVETVELFADGMSSKAALRRARQAVRSVRHALAEEHSRRTGSPMDRGGGRHGKRLHDGATRPAAVRPSLP